MNRGSTKAHHDDRPGKVYLVGAGPGDPRLITLRGSECLARAEVILYDCLVNPAILYRAGPAAERVCVKRPSDPDAPWHIAPHQTAARLIEAAQQGKIVVYIKGGDPDVFAHTARETEALAAAGIPFEIVPGITAAIAAAAYAGIPITHGQHASAVALVTAHQPRNQSEPLDYGALAEFPGTLVFYMGVETAPQWSQTLIARGKSPDTPVAIVRRCTWPDQQTVRCTLGTLAAAIVEHKLSPPTVILIGQVVALSSTASRFAARELFGRRILLTRPLQQAGPLQQRLADLGATVLLQEAIRISDPADWTPVDAALAELDRYDWLVFSSVNGVQSLLGRLWDRGGDLRRLGRLKLAAIGPATAEELRRYHLQADLVPREYRAEALAEALVCQARDQRFLLARASRGREVLAERLAAAGGTVDQIVVYSSGDVQQADGDVAAALSQGRIDWITVTSSAIARSLVSLFGDELRKSKLLSISPVTSEVLRQLGHEPAAEAEEYTMDGLVAAILAAGG